MALERAESNGYGVLESQRYDVNPNNGGSHPPARKPAG
jgi:hypothetical protein